MALNQQISLSAQLLRAEKIFKASMNTGVFSKILFECAVAGKVKKTKDGENYLTLIQMSSEVNPALHVFFEEKEIIFSLSTYGIVEKSRNGPKILAANERWIKEFLKAFQTKTGALRWLKENKKYIIGN